MVMVMMLAFRVVFNNQQKNDEFNNTHRISHIPLFVPTNPHKILLHTSLFLIDDIFIGKLYSERQIDNKDGREKVLPDCERVRKRVKEKCLLSDAVQNPNKFHATLDKCVIIHHNKGRWQRLRIFL